MEKNFRTAILMVFTVLFTNTMFCLADYNDTTVVGPNPESSEDWITMGNWLFNRSLPDGLQYEYADTVFSVALLIDSTNTDGWLRKGDALFEQGLYEEAVQAYDVAIKLDPMLTAAIKGKEKAITKIGPNDTMTGSVQKKETLPDEKVHTIIKAGGVN